MNKNLVKVAAVAAAAICALPMASAFSANAAYNHHFASELLYGDVNEDGVVDACDASRVLNYLAANDAGTPCNDILGDVNNNEKLDEEDAKMILSAYAKIGSNKDLRGDANNDGVVNIGDAVVINGGRAKNMIYADVNRDGFVNKVDSQLIQRYCLRCFTSFNYNFGDVDNNGILTQDDYTSIQFTRYNGVTWDNRSKKRMSTDLFIRMDANGDGIITSADKNSIRSAFNANGYTE